MARTAPPASRPPLSRKAWATISVTTVALFMVTLDISIVSLALPEIQADFAGTKPSTLSWVFTTYNIGVASLLLVAGRVADRAGRKRVFLWGLGAFALGSAISGAAPGVGLIIAGRAVQSVGGAMLLPTGPALLLADVPVERRSFALGIQGATAGLGAAVGPTIGALLIDAAGWRWVFFVNLVPVAYTLWRGSRVLTEAHGELAGQRVDTLAVPVGAIGVGLLAFSITQGEEWGWAHVGVIASAVGGVVLVAVLALRSMRHPRPLLDLTLYRVRSFTISSVSVVFFAMAFFGWVVLMPLFLVQAWGYSALAAGFALAPGPALSALVSPFAGRLCDHFGHRWVASAGIACCAIGPLWWALAVGDHSAFATTMLPGQLIIGLGAGFTFSPLYAAALVHLPPAKFAIGASTRTTAYQLAVALGVAVAVALLGDPGPGGLLDGFQRVWWASTALFLVGAAIAAAGLPSRRPGLVGGH